jgi:ketosteroid isomerase-like protein
MDQKATFDSNIEEEFKDLDRGWVAAYLQGSTDLFDRVWADGFIFTFPFGEFANKKQEIANIKSGDLAFASLSTDDIRVKVYGKTAVMAGHFTMRGRNKDRDISGQYSFTNVLEKRSEESWQIVAAHAAHIA